MCSRTYTHKRSIDFQMSIQPIGPLHTFYFILSISDWWWIENSHEISHIWKGKEEEAEAENVWGSLALAKLHYRIYVDVEKSCKLWRQNRSLLYDTETVKFYIKHFGIFNVIDEAKVSWKLLKFTVWYSFE